MLDNFLCGAIGFVLGGILGGAVVGRHIAKEWYEKLNDADERNKLLVDEVVKLRGQATEKRENDITEKAEKVESKYEKLRKKYIPDEDDETEPAEEIDDYDDEDDDLIESDPSKIRVIKKQLFDEESNYRDVEQLKYYQMDGTLVDSDDEMLFDEESIIGTEAMDIIDETKSDYLYALDEAENKVYEIEIEHTLNYTRDIAGAYM